MAQFDENSRYNWQKAYIILFTAAFILLAWFVMSGCSAGFDRCVDQFAYSTRSALTKGIWTFLTYLANWRVIVAAIAVLLLIPATRRRFGVPLCVASLLTLPLYKILKTAFARPRPDPSLWLITEHDFSFPSGHCMNGMVFYGLLIVLVRKYCPSQRAANVITVLLALLLLAIGWSRIFLGVHHTTDVLAGYSAGIVCVSIASIIIDKRQTAEDA